MAAQSGSKKIVKVRLLNTLRGRIVAVASLIGAIGIFSVISVVAYATISAGANPVLTLPRTLGGGLLIVSCLVLLLDLIMAKFTLPLEEMAVAVKKNWPKVTRMLSCQQFPAVEKYTTLLRH